jgi:hypothetical protein
MPQDDNDLPPNYGIGSPYIFVDRWTPLPRWHWRSLMQGKRWYRFVFPNAREHEGVKWEYQTDLERARQALEEAYDPDRVRYHPQFDYVQIGKNKWVTKKELVERGYH